MGLTVLGLGLGICGGHEHGRFKTSGELCLEMDKVSGFRAENSSGS